MNISFFVVPIIGIIVIIVIIVQENALLDTLELTNSALRKGHFYYATVWCLVTPSTVVCSGFTATRSLLNHFTAATDYDSTSRY